MTIIPITLHELINPEGYYLRCKSCRYSRAFGVLKFTCEQKAARHHLKFPWHEVGIYCNDFEYMTLDANEQSMLEYPDEIPF